MRRRSVKEWPLQRALQCGIEQGRHVICRACPVHVHVLCFHHSIAASTTAATRVPQSCVHDERLPRGANPALATISALPVLAEGRTIAMTGRRRTNPYSSNPSSPLPTPISEPNPDQAGGGPTLYPQRGDARLPAAPPRHQARQHGLPGRRQPGAPPPDTSPRLVSRPHET